MQVAVVFFIAVLGSAGIFQYYESTLYFRSFRQQAHVQNQLILEEEQKLLNNKMEQFIQFGSDLAVSDELYTKASAVQGKNVFGPAQYALNQYMAARVQYYPDFKGFAVITADKILYQFNRNSKNSYDFFWNNDNKDILFSLYSDVFQKISSKNVPRYAISYAPDFDSSGNRIIHIAYPIIGHHKELNAVNSVLVVTYHVDFLNNFLEADSYQNNYTRGIVTDDQDRIIFAGAKDLLNRHLNKYAQQHGMSVQLFTLSQYGLNLNIVTNNKLMRVTVMKSYLHGLMIYLILIIGVIFLMMAILRKALSPVTVIQKAMQSVENGKLDQKIEIHGENELWNLAQHYNQMLDSLSEQRQKVQNETQAKIESTKRANEAERTALESQINAHFLCNTLNAINYSAMDNHDNQVSLLLRKLSNILRYTFSRSYENVTIAQEMAWVEQYLYLEKFRKMDLFNYEIHCPEEYDEWPCCKLFLQPFIENSIHHGFNGIESGGQIKIDVRDDKDRLLVTISDNGCGMAEPTRSVIQAILKKKGNIDLHGSTVGIGIQNVTARLRMYYGDEFDIKVKTEIGKGTSFYLWLPIPPSMRDPDVEEDLV